MKWLNSILSPNKVFQHTDTEIERNKNYIVVCKAITVNKKRYRTTMNFQVPVSYILCVFMHLFFFSQWHIYFFSFEFYDFEICQSKTHAGYYQLWLVDSMCKSSGSFVFGSIDPCNRLKFGSSIENTKFVHILPMMVFFYHFTTE